MSNDFSLSRDLLEELISLVNSRQSFSDIHLEQDMPMMIKTPRGWRQVGAEAVTLEDMVPVLKAIDDFNREERLATERFMAWLHPFDERERQAGRDHC